VIPGFTLTKKVTSHPELACPDAYQDSRTFYDAKKLILKKVLKLVQDDNDSKGTWNI
jgi:hypothetical protein